MRWIETRHRTRTTLGVCTRPLTSNRASDPGLTRVAAAPPAGGSSAPLTEWTYSPTGERMSTSHARARLGIGGLTRRLLAATAYRSSAAADTASTRPRIGLERRSGGKGHRRLTHLNEMSIGTADVRPDFAAVVLRLGQELRALCRPLPIGAGDVRHPHVEKRTRAIGIRRRRQGHRWLVVSGTAAGVEDEPGVGGGAMLPAYQHLPR